MVEKEMYIHACIYILYIFFSENSGNYTDPEFPTYNQHKIWQQVTIKFPLYRQYYNVIYINTGKEINNFDGGLKLIQSMPEKHLTNFGLNYLETVKILGISEYCIA